MGNIWFYATASVLAVSFLSLIGIFTLSIKEKLLHKVLVYFISFSAGALFGDAFIHLLPELVEEKGFGLDVSFYILLGIIFFFVIEKFIHWRHCHHLTSEDHPHPFAYMNLLGDAAHNFLDGLIIGAAYLVDVKVGVATTVAVALHEIPQEIGDFGVLIHGGFSKSKALLLNFLVSLTSLAGLVIALWLGFNVENITYVLVPVAAGGFIYIAGSDLIPELHKEDTKFKAALAQLAAFLLGIFVMYSLIFVEAPGHEGQFENAGQQSLDEVNSTS